MQDCSWRLILCVFTHTPLSESEQCVFVCFRARLLPVESIRVESTPAKSGDLTKDTVSSQFHWHAGTPTHSLAQFSVLNSFLMVYECICSDCVADCRVCLCIYTANLMHRFDILTRIWCFVLSVWIHLAYIQLCLYQYPAGQFGTVLLKQWRGLYK